MSMSQGTTSASQWWRWPVMPFAAVIGGAVGALLFTALQWLGMKFQGGFSADGWAYIYVLPVISAATFGYLYTYISCTVAPSGKFTAGVVMTSFYGVLGTLLCVLMWFNPDYTTGRAVVETIRFLAGIGAAIVALVQVRDELR